MVLNEFVVFAELGKIKDSLRPRTFTIASFALCGFANFSSIGIQIGGIGALAPEQRDQLAKFGIRAMLAGTMANLISASIVGIFGYHSHSWLCLVGSEDKIALLTPGAAPFGVKA